METKVKTKQEEIEEALARELRDLKHRSYDSLQAAQWILGILDGLGAVLKVDRELPKKSVTTFLRFLFLGERDSLAGYEAVEPLIEAGHEKD